MPLAMAQNNNPLVIVNNNVTACETYTWSINNTTYTNSTVATYLDTTGDTLHVLNLTVNHIYNNTEALISNLCAYTWRGNTYYHSGTYSDTVLANSSLGTCDSFFTVTLTIPTSEVINQTVNACGSYVWNDSTYTETGIYSVSSQIVNPDLSTCTHIDQLTLNIVNTLNVDETVEQCGHYTWYGETYDQTGVYTHVESDTTIGCDTIHTLNLTVVVNTAEPLLDSACSYYIWRRDTITTSGLYTINDTNASTGCVTIRSINLNIKPFRTPVRDTTMVGCNGISFTVSSLAGSTIKRFSVDTTFDTNLIDRRWARCYDSTIHLNVIVHKSGYDTTYANACDSFYWKLNKKTYYKTPTTNPTYAFASDQYNCDSIMVLVLNVKTSPVIAVSEKWPKARKAGSVGPALPGVDIKISPENNEICCRGHNVMMGYYKDDAKTKEAIDEDGWFHTGDTGRFDKYKRLYITGRIKSLFKTSMGKYINPEILEQKYCESPLIDQMMVVGENKKFAAALVVPNFDNLREAAAKNGIETGTNIEMANDPKINRLVADDMKKYDKFFGDWEHIKKIKLISDEWNQESGFITPTLKLKRNVISDRYEHEIEELFS